MGRPIVYCAECGGALRDEDFQRGGASLSENQPYCSRCRPPTPAPRGASPSRRSSRPIAVVAGPRPATTRRTTAPRAKLPVAAFAAAGGAALLLVIVVAAVLSRSQPKTEVAVRPPPVETPPAPLPAPAPRRAAPARVETPPPQVEVPSPPADPNVALDRWLEDIRKLREQDPGFGKAVEVRSMLRQAVAIAPASRRPQVELIAAEYENAATSKAPPKEPATAVPGFIAGFTLINADTAKPVPGFDPVPEGATIDLSKIGTRKLNLRANVAGGKVGCIRFSVNDQPTVVEWTAPHAVFGDQHGKYKPWTPPLGLHCVRADVFSVGDPKGNPVSNKTLRFTVVDPR